MPEAPPATKQLLTLHEALVATLPYLELLAEAFTQASADMKALIDADRQHRNGQQ